MGSSAGPDIINNGLIFCTDAASKNSYPGSGTNWSDLVSNTDLTLNGATFDSTYSAINLDGTDDYMTCESITCGDIWSQQCFFRPSNQSSGGYGYFNISWNAISEGGSASISAQKKLYIHNGAPQIVSTSQFETNTWYHITWVFNTTNSTIKVYVNGQLDKTTSITGTFNTSTYKTFSGLGRYTSSSHYLNGKLGNFMIYNRELTALEVLQNYNQQRSRFGV